MAGSNFYTKINSTLWIALTDESGYATHAKCTGTPPTTASLFLHGCQMIQTDTATGAKSLFENIGSTAVPEWNLLGDVTAGEITLATGSMLIGAAGVAAALDVKGSGKITVGNGTTATSVAVSGDATLSTAGALTIAAGAVTNAKVADSTGASALGIRKSATVVYDFAVDGGVAGNIVLTGAPTIPDNAVVWLESYDVITTCTSVTDAATIAIGFATDGAISTAIAISAGANAWDAGAFALGTGGTASPLPKKLTAARVPGLVVAGGENLTAGKIVFQLAYWVSA